jgi:hypothetical protein
MITNGIEDDMLRWGETHCSGLCVLKVKELFTHEEEYVDTLKKLENLDKIALDGTIFDWQKVMDALVGAGKLKYRYADGHGRGDFVIAEWYNKRTNRTHFTVIAPDTFDPLFNSVTVAEGLIRSTRIYDKVGK